MQFIEERSLVPHWYMLLIGRDQLMLKLASNRCCLVVVFSIRFFILQNLKFIDLPAEIRQLTCGKAIFLEITI